jgi:ferredoxin
MSTREPKRPHGPIRRPAPPTVIRCVTIEATCDFCGTCLALCPDVFVFSPHGVEVVDTNLKDQTADIVAAAEACPLVAIRLT